MRPEQLDDDETLDDLFQGASSRRNQVLLDLGRELALSGAEAVQRKPIGELVGALREQATHYRFPGPYLRDTVAAGLSRALGRSRPDARRRRRAARRRRGGSGPGSPITSWPCSRSRPGRGRRRAAARSGASPSSPAASPEQGRALVDGAAALAGEALGLRIVRAQAPSRRPRRRHRRPGTSPSPCRAGSRTRSPTSARALLAGLGRDGHAAAPGRHPGGAIGARADGSDATRLDGGAAGAPARGSDAARADGRAAAQSGDAAAPDGGPRSPSTASRCSTRSSAPRARGRSRRASTTAATSASRRSGRARAGTSSPPTTRACAATSTTTSCAASRRTAATRCSPQTARFLPARALAHGEPHSPPRSRRSRAAGARAPLARRPAPGRRDRARRHPARRHGTRSVPPARPRRAPVADAARPGASSAAPDLSAALRGALAAQPDLGAETALVTGASPGSIAAELVRGCCAAARPSSSRRRPTRPRGGAGTASCTAPRPARARSCTCCRRTSRRSPTSTRSPLARAARDRRTAAGPTCASTRCTPRSSRRSRRSPPPASSATPAPAPSSRCACSCSASSGSSRRSPRTCPTGRRPRRCCCPLSPNHGGFGGDGAYGETKAALEALLARWHSERATGVARMRIVAPRIGWVRGTGLMGAADAVAALVEERLGVRTFSAEEMGWLLSVLAGPGQLRERPPPAARGRPQRRPERDRRPARRRRAARRGAARSRGGRTAARRARRRHCAAGRAEHVVDALPSCDTDVAPPPTPPHRGVGPIATAWLTQSAATPRTAPPRSPSTPPTSSSSSAPPSSARAARPRRASTASCTARRRSAASASWRGCAGSSPSSATATAGRWIDAATRAEVHESQLAARYADAVATRIGVRALEDDGDVDAQGRDVLAPVALPAELRFAADDEHHARTFAAAGARLERDDGGTWQRRPARGHADPRPAHGPPTRAASRASCPPASSSPASASPATCSRAPTAWRSSTSPARPRRSPPPG